MSFHFCFHILEYEYNLTLNIQSDYKKSDETIFFLILRAIIAIEILKNRKLLFVLTRHFTTSQER